MGKTLTGNLNNRRGQLGSPALWNPAGIWIFCWLWVKGVEWEGEAMWRLSSALLLLSFPGCFSIQGPASVRGPENGSVTIRCRYSSRWQMYNKYWCRGADWSTCRVLIRTRGSEKEKKSGRLSLRDNWRDNSLLVTMEMLTQNDTDTYWCGIEKFGTDRGTRIKVTVYSEGKDTMSSKMLSTMPTMDSNAYVMSSDLHKRTHYLLLVFVKVPVLLILAGVVLWLKGSTQKVSEEEWRHTFCSNLDSELTVKDIAP